VPRVHLKLCDCYRNRVKSRNWVNFGYLVKCKSLKLEHGGEQLDCQVLAPVFQGLTGNASTFLHCKKHIFVKFLPIAICVWS
jgi:hypothetical protein